MTEQTKAMLASDIVLSILAGKPKALELLELPSEVDLCMADFSLYEALCSIEKGELDLEALRNLINRVSIIRTAIHLDTTEARIKHLRSVSKL